MIVSFALYILIKMLIYLFNFYDEQKGSNESHEKEEDGEEKFFLHRIEMEKVHENSCKFSSL